jgi:hypothetical protein
MQIAWQEQIPGEFDAFAVEIDRPRHAFFLSC